MTLPHTLAANDGAAGGPDTLVCTFTATISGDAGATHANTVTATVDDPDPSPPITPSDGHTVTFTNTAPTISVVKTGPATSPRAPGGLLHRDGANTSTRHRHVTALVDSAFGDLDGGAAPDCDPA